MESHEDDADLDIAQPAWVGYAKVAMLLGMVMIFYWLGQSMVASHFFSGE